MHAEVAAMCGPLEAGTEPVDESLHCAGVPNGLARHGLLDEDEAGAYGTHASGGDGGGGGMGDRRVPLTWREAIAIVVAVVGLVLQWSTLTERLSDVDGRLRTLSERMGDLDASVKTATAEVRAHVQSDGHRVELAGQEEMRRRLDLLEDHDRDTLRRPSLGSHP